MQKVSLPHAPGPRLFIFFPLRKPILPVCVCVCVCVLCKRELMYMKAPFKSKSNTI